MVARVCAAAVTLLGLLTCLEFVLGRELGIDQLFAAQAWAAPLSFGGRMPLITAISFTVTGSALLLLSTTRRRLDAMAQVLVLPVMFVALAGFAGHLFDARDMHALTQSEVASALPATILFLLVSRGLLDRHPDRGLMGEVSSNRPGGAMARWLLPAFVWISLALGLVLLVGQRVGLYDTGLMVALFVVANTVLAAALIWRTARSLNRADADRERAQQELEGTTADRSRQAAVYESVFTDMADGVYIMDRAGKVTANPAAVKLIGQPLIEMDPALWSQEYGLFLPDRKTVYPVADLPMAHALRGEAVSDAEIFVRNPGVPDGRLIEVTARPLRDESGQLNGALAVFRDITGRKRLEDAARQLRSTFDSALDSVVTMDDQGRIMDWNPTAEVMFGWPKSEVVGRTMAETIIPERYRGAHANGVRDAAGNGAGPVIGRRTEIEAVHRDGHEFKVELSIAATRSDNRYIFIGFIRDITERQRAKETRRRLAAVVDSSAESIYTLDLTGAITSWNPAAEQLLGYTPAEILGKHGSLLAAPGTTGDKAPRLLKGERIAPHQIHVVTKDGRQLTVSASISPLKDSVGRTAGAAIVLRDETEHQLRAAILESVLESIGDGVVIADEHGLPSFNAEAKRILGMDVDGIPGEEWTQRYAVYHPDQKTPYPPQEFPLAKALRGEALDETEIFVRHPGAPDGILVTVSAGPLRGPAGQALGAVAVFRDVTARRRSEEVQRQLAAVVQSSDDAIYAVNAQGLITAWNPGAERLLGWTAQEVIGQDPWTATRTPAEIERRQRLMRGDPANAFDAEVPGKDGLRIPVLASVSQMKDASGQVVGAAVILRDITETKRALETRLRLAAIVESSDDAIVGKDLDGGILSWNTGAERLYGYSAEEAEGKNISILVPGDRPNELSAILERVKRGERIEHYETVRVRKDGSRLDVSITISPLRDLSGTVVGASAITRDISEQKRADEEIRKLNAGLEQRIGERTAALEASNQELEAFSYSVSHDLRAPLRAINGFVELVVQEHAAQLAPEGRRYLDRVAAGARQMGQLIDDLLAFSRLGRTPLEKRNVAAVEVVERALEQLRPLMEDRAVELTVGDLPMCTCSPSLLEQVFVNLIGNALKYSRGREPARIDVSARVDPVSNETVFAVRDNGVGFDMQYAEKLFGVFQRLHRAEDYEGTGVGLAIVQRIVHRHGGRVWAQAEPEKGATFCFTLGGTTEWLPAAA